MSRRPSPSTSPTARPRLSSAAVVRGSHCKREVARAVVHPHAAPGGTLKAIGMIRSASPSPSKSPAGARRRCSRDGAVDGGTSRRVVAELAGPVVAQHGDRRPRGRRARQHQIGVAIPVYVYGQDEGPLAQRREHAHVPAANWPLPRLIVRSSPPGFAHPGLGRLADPYDVQVPCPHPGPPSARRWWSGPSAGESSRRAGPPRPEAGPHPAGWPRRAESPHQAGSPRPGARPRIRRLRRAGVGRHAGIRSRAARVWRSGLGLRRRRPPRRARPRRQVKAPSRHLRDRPSRRPAGPSPVGAPASPRRQPPALASESEVPTSTMRGGVDLEAAAGEQHGRSNGSARDGARHAGPRTSVEPQRTPWGPGPPASSRERIPGACAVRSARRSPRRPQRRHQRDPEDVEGGDVRAPQRALVADEELAPRR
jgi:hypothetical protein